jgi:hypothetical protein
VRTENVGLLSLKNISSWSSLTITVTSELTLCKVLARSPIARWQASYCLLEDLVCKRPFAKPGRRECEQVFVRHGEASVGVYQLAMAQIALRIGARLLVASGRKHRAVGLPSPSTISAMLRLPNATTRCPDSRLKLVSLSSNPTITVGSPRPCGDKGHYRGARAARAHS